MTQKQTAQLAALIRQRRGLLGLSMRELAVRAGLQISTLSGLEAGKIQAPKIDTIAALAEPLHMSVADLYSLIGLLPVNELPSFRPYMRAKYRDLGDDAIREIERHINELTKRIDHLGPIDHEDELPE